MKESIRLFLEETQPKDLTNALNSVLCEAFVHPTDPFLSAVCSVFSPPLPLATIRFLPSLSRFASSQHISLHPLFERCFLAIFSYCHDHPSQSLFIDASSSTEVSGLLRESEYLRALCALYDQRNASLFDDSSDLFPAR